MFTGLVEELGRVRRLERQGAFQRLEIAAEHVLSDLAVGDSVNIDGACQTAVAVDESGFAVESVAETLGRQRGTVGELSGRAGGVNSTQGATHDRKHVSIFDIRRTPSAPRKKSESKFGVGKMKECLPIKG